MKLLIIRHAPAGDKTAWARRGKADSLRPLTDKGRSKMRRAANVLREIVGSVDLIVTSPFLRARQTADAVAKVFRAAKVEKVGELSPDSSPKDFAGWLGARSERVIALVGHEPHLGRLCSFLCTGRAEPFMDLKKGQACMLEFEGPTRPGRARVLWSLRPAQLRRLAN